MRSTLFAYAVPLLMFAPVNSPAAPDEPAAVATFFRVLVGHPEPAPGGESVLVIPGTVLASVGTSDTSASDVLRVIDELKSSYRLGSIDVVSSVLVPLTRGQTTDVGSIPGGPSITATMMQFDDKAATIRVSLTENGKVLAEPTIRERRGGRSVVGTRNGPAAPYVFLLAEPLRGPVGLRRASGSSAAGPVSVPKLIKKVQPAYPDEARKAKFEGLVVLDCTIGTDGRVKGCTASRREPMGLTEAALGAVAQWEYEPARDSAGQPIEVLMSVTFRFALS